MSTTDAKEERKPYERMPGEPNKAWRAFCIYRNLGLKRTQDKASAEYHKDKPGESQSSRKQSRASGRIKSWCHQWNWAERAAAYDADVDTENRRAQMDEIKEANRRLIKQAKALQFKAVERLAQMDPADLTPTEVLRYIVEASKLERLAMGQATEHIQEDSSQKVEMSGEVIVPLVKGATDAELAEMRSKCVEIRDRLRAGLDATDDRSGDGGAESP